MSPGPRVLEDPAPPEARLGPVRGCCGKRGDTHAGWQAPPSALSASQGLLTKLHFEINSVAAGASEGYGCHGDGAE